MAELVRGKNSQFKNQFRVRPLLKGARRIISLLLPITLLLQTPGVVAADSERGLTYRPRFIVPLFEPNDFLIRKTLSKKGTEQSSRLMTMPLDAKVDDGPAKLPDIGKLGDLIDLIRKDEESEAGPELPPTTVYTCDLFSSPEQSELMQALDNIKDSAKSLNGCVPNKGDNQNSDKDIASIEKDLETVRNTAAKYQDLLRRSESELNEMLRSEKIEEVQSDISLMFKTMGDVYGKIESKRQSSQCKNSRNNPVSRFVFGLNDVLTGLTPFALLAGSLAVKSALVQGTTATAGAVAVSNPIAVGLIGTVAVSTALTATENMMNEKDPFDLVDTQNPAIKSLCELSRVKRKLNEINEIWDGRRKVQVKLSKELNSQNSSNVNIARLERLNIPDSVREAIAYKMGVDQIIKKIGERIGLIMQKSFDIRARGTVSCDAGLAFSRFEKSRPNEGVINLIAKDVENLESYYMELTGLVNGKKEVSEGYLQILVSRIKAENIDKLNAMIEGKTSLNENEKKECSDLTLDLAVRMETLSKRVESRLNSILRIVNAQLLKSDEYKKWFFEYTRTKMELEQQDRLDTIYAGLASGMSNTFRSQLLAKFEETYDILLKGSDSPISKVFRSKFRELDLRDERLFNTLDVLRSTAKEIALAKIPKRRQGARMAVNGALVVGFTQRDLFDIFRQVNDEGNISNLSYINLTNLPVGDRRHSEVCNNINYAINEWDAITTANLANLDICAMLSFFLDKQKSSYLANVCIGKISYAGDKKESFSEVENRINRQHKKEKKLGDRSYQEYMKQVIAPKLKELQCPRTNVSPGSRVSLDAKIH